MWRDSEFVARGAAFITAKFARTQSSAALPQILGPIRSKRFDPEVHDGEPQEYLDRDPPGRAVRRTDLVSLASGAGTEVQVRELNRTLALRMPVVGNHLLVVGIVQRVVVSSRPNLPWPTLAGILHYAIVMDHPQAEPSRARRVSPAGRHR